MTTYPGPWIQAPDYEKADLEVPMSESIPHHANVHLTEEITDTFEPYEAGDFVSKIMTSHLAPLIPSGEAGEGGMRVEAVYGIVPGPPIKNRRVGDVWRAWRVSTISSENLGVANWAPTGGSVPEVPLGAVDWEFLDGTTGEVKKADVIALNADLEVSRSFASDFVQGQLTAPFMTAIESSSGHFRSDDGISFVETDELLAWDGPGAMLPDMTDADAHPGLITLVGGPVNVPADGSGNLHFPYDLTPFLDSRGRIVLSSYVTFDTVHPEFGATPIPPQDLSQDDSVEYGHNLLWHPVWTFRPPVFRWLFNTPQIHDAPPLRHTQRDDRFGPSPRNTPGRTRQASLRNTGIL